MPKPKRQFSRPRIDLDQVETRVWRDIPVREIQIGDIWADHGKVRSVIVQQHNTSVLAGISFAPNVMASDTVVKVFTKPAPKVRT